MQNFFFPQGFSKIMIAFKIAHHVFCILLENYYDNPVRAQVPRILSRMYSSAIYSSITLLQQAFS